MLIHQTDWTLAPYRHQSVEYYDARSFELYHASSMLAGQRRSRRGPLSEKVAGYRHSKLQELNQDQAVSNGHLDSTCCELHTTPSDVSTTHYSRFLLISPRFNSAIFVSLTANEYVVAAVTEDFINGASWTLPGPEDYHYLLLANLQQNLSTLERLESPDCIREYGSDYVSDRRHALVVVSGQESDSLIGILAWHYNKSQNSWVCGANIEPGKKMQPYSLIDYDCSTSIALANDTWLIGDREVGYCLSQAVEDRCRLQFAVPIMIVVICSNVLKLACMVFTIWHCKESTFVTLGDAVSGFLEKPDPYTAGMCIATKKDFQDGAWPDQEPMRWTVRRHFWYEAVGIARYVLSNIL